MSEPLLFRRPNGRTIDLNFEARLNAAIADALTSSGKAKKADLIRRCSRSIEVVTLQKSDGQLFNQLINRERCRQRGCIYCDRMLSWERRADLLQTIDRYDVRRYETHPITVVLTRPAVSYRDLRAELQAFGKAARKLVNHPRFKAAFSSWFRSTEFNYNSATKTCNVHQNYLLFGHPWIYDEPDSYLPQDQLADLWAQCCGTTKKRICWIQQVQPDRDGSLLQACRETAKYFVKSYAFAHASDGKVIVDPDVYPAILDAVHAYRFTAFGGHIKNVRARIKKENNEPNKRVSYAERLGATHVKTERWTYQAASGRYTSKP